MDTLTRARKFSQEPDPKLCTCKHERCGTGYFFGSVKLIQCMSCRGWQDVEKPIT